MLSVCVCGSVKCLKWMLLSVKALLSHAASNLPVHTRETDARTRVEKCPKPAAGLEINVIQQV